MRAVAPHTFALAAALVLLATQSSASAPEPAQASSELVAPSRSLRGGGPQARIVGGTEVTNRSKWAYMTALFERGWNEESFVCGGMMIAPRVLLTAAHCTGGIDRALVGTLDRRDGQGGTKVNLSRLRKHPGWDGHANDVAVYRLDQPVSGPFVTVNSNSNVPSGNEQVETAGWGATFDPGNGFGDSPNKLREVAVNYVSQARCRKSFGSDLSDDMLCAAAPGRDSCNGDSGGPLVTSNGNVLVGVVSWGERCAGSTPGVYNRVSYSYSWIREQVCDLSDGDAPSSFDCGSGGGGGGGGGGGNDNDDTPQAQDDDWSSNNGGDDDWDSNNGGDDDDFFSGMFQDDNFNFQFDDDIWNDDGEWTDDWANWASGGWDDENWDDENWDDDQWEVNTGGKWDDDWGTAGGGGGWDDDYAMSMSYFRKARRTTAVRGHGRQRRKGSSGGSPADPQGSA